MKLFKTKIPLIEKIKNFQLFATTANDKKEHQISVLNDRALSKCSLHPSDLPLVYYKKSKNMKHSLYFSVWA